MPGDFFERTALLEEMVGSGELTVKVEVDQPYAAPIHNSGWIDWFHPYPRSSPNYPGHHEGPHGLRQHSGEPMFLTRSLYEGWAEWMESYAATTLAGGLKTTAIAISEDLAKRSSERTPRRSGRLANSDHPSVTDEGEVIYDRPPSEPRMAEKVHGYFREHGTGATGLRTWAANRHILAREPRPTRVSPEG